MTKRFLINTMILRELSFDFYLLKYYIFPYAASQEEATLFVIFEKKMHSTLCNKVPVFVTKYELSGISKKIKSIVCSERCSLLLDAWDGLRYFIVALAEPSIQLFCILSLGFTCYWNDFRKNTYFFLNSKLVINVLIHRLKYIYHTNLEYKK